MIRFITGVVICFFLAALASAQVSVGLTWTASTDNVKVAGYNVYRDGVKIGTSPTTSYTDANAAENTTYSYTVQAFDTAGNLSGLTQPAVILTGLKHGGGTTSAFQIPGPSTSLFNNPYYSCNTNRYIATAANGGSDSNDGTTPAVGGGHGPWFTLMHADAASPSAGWCINVQPGTYATGIWATHGGSSATSAGYVVYRCTVMNACTITDVGGSTGSTAGAMGVYAPLSAAGPSYIMFDGFTLTGNSTTPAGIGFIANQNNGNPAVVQCCHHIWFLNSIVSGYGQSGFQGGLSDFIYIIHNTFFNNAVVNCGAAEGSGISMVWPMEAAGYTLLADDKNNSVTGNLAAGSDWFRQVYSWNHIYNNREVCGISTSDGNGIILDKWYGSPGGGGGPGVYARQGLVSFNVVYNSGGKGIHVFINGSGTHTAGVGVTVANNSVYFNNQDTQNSGGDRYGIGEGVGDNNTFVNNISVAIQTADFRNTGFGGDSSGTTGGTVSTFVNNISFCTISLPQPTCQYSSGGSTWGSNQAQTNPLFADVGRTSVGSMSTQPNGHNFALCTAAGVPNAACSGASPAVGYLQTHSYLPANTRDSGACDRSLTTCP